MTDKRLMDDTAAEGIDFAYSAMTRAMVKYEKMSTAEASELYSRMMDLADDMEMHGGSEGKSESFGTMQARRSYCLGASAATARWIQTAEIQRLKFHETWDAEAGNWDAPKTPKAEERR